MSLLLVTFMLAGALAASAAAPVVKAPPGWKTERKTDGLMLTGPSAEGIDARVVARWVRSDHKLYGTPKAYMARLTKASSIPTPGWRNGAVENVLVSGRAALRLERDTTDYSSPKSVSPKEVTMREEHVAVPAKDGFYLLVYAAPLSIDAAQRPVFRRLVDDFKPDP